MVQPSTKNNSFYIQILSICYIAVAMEDTKIDETNKNILLAHKEFTIHKDLPVAMWEAS